MWDQLQEYDFTNTDLFGMHVVAIPYVCQHDVFGALHVILGFLRPSSRAPAVERIDPARCVLHARCEALRGVARRRSFAERCAEACVPIRGVRASQSRGFGACIEVCAFRNQEVVIHAWKADV